MPVLTYLDATWSIMRDNPLQGTDKTIILTVIGSIGLLVATIISFVTQRDEYVYPIWIGCTIAAVCQTIHFINYTGSLWLDQLSTIAMGFVTFYTAALTVSRYRTYMRSGRLRDDLASCGLLLLALIFANALLSVMYSPTDSFLYPIVTNSLIVVRSLIVIWPLLVLGDVVVHFIRQHHRNRDARTTAIG